MIYLPCGHTITDAELLSLAGSVLGRRQTPHGGRKPKLAPCPKCGIMFGVRAMREHARECQKRATFEMHRTP